MGQAGAAFAAVPASVWPRHSGTSGHAGSYTNDSCTPVRRMLHTGRDARPGPQYGTVQWPPWRPDGWAARGRQIWRDRRGHSVGRFPPVRAWQTSQDHESPSRRRLMASVARASALTVRWVERAVVVGELWPR